MDINGVTPFNPAPKLPPDVMQKIGRAAEEFEAMFYTEMFGHMMSDLEVDPVFGGGKGEEIFRSMLVQEYGKAMAKSPSGVGLSQQLQKSMIELQLAAQNGKGSQGT